MNENSKEKIKITKNRTNREENWQLAIGKYKIYTAYVCKNNAAAVCCWLLILSLCYAMLCYAMQCTSY